MTKVSTLLDRWRELHETRWSKEVSKEKWFNNAIEECAELIQAIQHYKRKRVAFKVIRNELADVAICIEMLLATEDNVGIPITDNIKLVAKYNIAVLEGKIEPVHNDGEDEPPVPLDGQYSIKKPAE